MPRKNANTRESSLPSPEAPAATIAGDGTVLLQLQDLTAGIEQYYRCSRRILRNTSKYFNVLLDPVKFSEGIAMEARVQELSQKYPDPTSIPPSELPIVKVTNEGLPEDSAATRASFRLFLNILHNPAMPWPISRPQSVNSIALLAIIADSFSAVDHVAAYLRKQSLGSALMKDRKATTAHHMELENRQRLLAGLTFGIPDWVRQFSAALIVEGPKRSKTMNLEISEEEHDEQGSDALWWRLPGGVEGTCPADFSMRGEADRSLEELICRRDYTLETINSIQKHFLSLYMSRQPQCRLGYGSSPQCDSFQLGEMVRFFGRKGTLRIESTFAPTPEDYEPYNGNVNDIISKLKESPSYQIDVYHQHCGLRSRLIPILEAISPLGQVGICLQCWGGNRGKESWLDNPKQGKWDFRKTTLARGCQEHQNAKAMYTAEERDWTPLIPG
ncbi:hypothetical protein MMC28_004894 [Mycoblastus sanguinarius]|nr:hypothetical protein [Mycoblastus sanguinarius]